MHLRNAARLSSMSESSCNPRIDRFVRALHEIKQLARELNPNLTRVQQRGKAEDESEPLLQRRLSRSEERSVCGAPRPPRFWRHLVHNEGRPDRRARASFLKPRREALKIAVPPEDAPPKHTLAAVGTAAVGTAAATAAAAAIATIAAAAAAARCCSCSGSGAVSLLPAGTHWSRRDA